MAIHERDSTSEEPNPLEQLKQPLLTPAKGDIPASASPVTEHVQQAVHVPQESTSTAPSIQKAHGVSRSPPGFFRERVARSVLPALNKTPAAPRSAEPSITKLLKDLAPIGVRKGALTADAEVVVDDASQEKVSYPYHVIKFNESEDYTVLQVPPNTIFDVPLAELLDKYKKEGKNVIIVCTKQARPGSETLEDPDDSFSHSGWIKEGLSEAMPHAQFTLASEYPKVTQSSDALLSITWGLSPEQRPHASVREVNIASTHGAVLNGIEIRLDTPQGLEAISRPQVPPERQKWIVYYNKNEATVEEETQFLAHTAKIVGANVISCDYRGVGKSTGFPHDEQDLIDDGDAVVQYLRDQGVPPENILVYGTSLGGAIATHVAERRAAKGEKMSLCSDRSFSKLSMAIKTIFKVIDKTFGRLATFARQVAAYVTEAYGWKLDSASKLPTLLEKGVKVTIMHHAGDHIITREAAAVKVLPEKHTAQVIELTDTEASIKAALEKPADKKAEQAKTAEKVEKAAKGKAVKKAKKKAKDKAQEKTKEKAPEKPGIFERIGKKLGIGEETTFAHNRRLYANEEELFVQAAKQALDIPQDMEGGSPLAAA